MSDLFTYLFFSKILEQQSLSHARKPVNTNTPKTSDFSSVLSQQLNGKNNNKNNTAQSTGFNNIINEMSLKYNVPSNLINAVIRTESNFDPLATSHAGAQGLMQLMPATARSLGVTNPFDPRQNIEAGTKYLSQMLNRFDGNLTLALAAYNAGPGNVQKYRGVPPFSETQNYIRKVKSLL